MNAARNRLTDLTAAIKHTPHAKGYLKFEATPAEIQAYNSTSRLHTSQVVRAYRAELEAAGCDLSGIRLAPIRNAGNTSPGMDLDLAVFTPPGQTHINFRDPKTGTVSRMPLYQANGRMQEIFDGVYARNSGGRSARASWQMVTTSKNLEAYPEMGWLRIKKNGAKGVDPFASLSPKYAEDAARVTEIKADELRQQSGLGRDNQNWEIYRGTSKDIKTKVLPLITGKLKANMTPAARRELMDKYEFYKRLSESMDLANNDPVAAERALRKMTGYESVDLVRMVSAGIEALGKWK